MEQNIIEEWFRKEVLNNKELYPNLYDTEIAKNKHKFEDKQ